MGFESKRHMPDFVRRAAMAEDGSKLRKIASRGGKATARARAERKQRADAAAAEAEKVRERLEAAKWAFLKDPAILRDAERHARLIDPREKED